MTLLQALATLAATKMPVFHTSDAAACLGVSNAYASTMLARFAASGHVVRLRRGVWAFPDRIDPVAVPEHLTFPFPSYVSLQSALYLRGMISQVPSVTYAVSLARTRRFATPLGTFSIHHVEPRFFFGFEEVGRQGGHVATAEKALVDFLYLGPARSGLFRALPELEWPRNFSVHAAQSIVKRIEPARRRTLVSRTLERVLRARATEMSGHSRRRHPAR